MAAAKGCGPKLIPNSNFGVVGDEATHSASESERPAGRGLRKCPRLRLPWASGLRLGLRAPQIAGWLAWMQLPAPQWRAWRACRALCVGAILERALSRPPGRSNRADIGRYDNGDILTYPAPPRALGPTPTRPESLRDLDVWIPSLNGQTGC